MNEVERRREHVIARHNEGWSYKRIGEELGISGVQVGRLYKLGLADREKRKAEAAQAAATPATPVEALGLHGDVTTALIRMGCTDLLSILTQDWTAFQAKVRRYPNVRRRVLQPLLAIRERFEGTALEVAGQKPVSGPSADDGEA